MDETKPPGIQIGQIFLLRALFEHAPNALTVPPNTPIANIKTAVNARIGINEDGQNGYVVLTVQTAPDEEALYHFHVEMMLLVRVAEEPNLELREYLARSGPATLYPFARETVASLTMKGRFGPIWISPLNFVAVGEQLLKATPEVRTGDVLNDT